MLENGPYFVGPIIAGFVMGMFSRRYFRSSAAAWVWIVPMLFLLEGISAWKTGGVRQYWEDVWNNYSGS